MDDFNCVSVVRLLGYEFVATCESSCAQEVAFDVLGDGVGFKAVVLNLVQVVVGWIGAGVRSGWICDVISNDIYINYTNKIIDSPVHSVPLRLLLHRPV